MRGLLFIVALSGCNLVFGLDEPQDDGDGGIDAPRGYSDPVISFIPDARDVAVMTGGPRPGQRVVVGSAAGALFHIIADAARDVSATSLVVAEAPVAIAAIDGDADDISDLLVSTASSVTYYRGTGDGEPPIGELELTKLATDLLTVGAFESASADDFVAAHIGSLAVSEWLGNSAGGFTPGVTFPADGEPGAMVAVDVDGDALDELVVADNLGVRMYKRSQTGFAANGDTLTGPVLAVHAMRLDLDDTFDILLGDAAGTIAVWFGDGNGGFGPGRSLMVEPSTTMALAHGDVDGDGRADDLAVAAAGAVTLFVTGDDGTYTPSDRFVTGEVSAVAFADLDGDGQDDLVVLQPAADQVLIFFAR